jgi:phage protein D
MTYTSTLTLKIDGTAATDALLADILQVSVEESLHLPGMFTLVINNNYYPGNTADAAWTHDALFAIGKTVEIGFTSSTTDATEYATAKTATVLKGEITAIEAQFTSESQAPIIIRGYDASHRLHRGRQSRSFTEMKDSDIVSQVAGGVGLTVSATDTVQVHKYVFQENQTNMEFLRERAARNGFELFMQDGTLKFRKPASGGSVTLTWLKDLLSFRVRVSSSEQVGSVEVRGWDYVTGKAAIVSTANSATLLTSNDHGTGVSKAAAFSGKPSGSKLIVVDLPVWSSAESDKIAQSLFDELGGEYIHADARADGNPDIRPGKVVTLANMGKYNGSYYVTATRHLYQGRIYSTEFSVRGLRGGDLLSTLSPKARLQPGQTLLVGKVSNNVDPNKLGRVKVKFPTLTEDHESNWARVVALGAGANRGFDNLPEIGDEVVVGFEHGDIHRPYVLGGVWNNTDAAAISVDESVADGKVRLRTIKTRLGHMLQFVEEDKDSSKQGIYLTTKYGHNVNLNDTDKYIELKTKDGHYVKIDDTNKKIEVKTKAGQKMEMLDSGNKIAIEALTNIEIKVGGSSITLTTTGIELKTGASKITLGSASLAIESASTNLKGTGQAKVEGATVTVEGQTMTMIKGAILKLN